ncbi:MAG: hypothetical protein V1816_13235, partial [Pseudomonadota bacterium]
YFASRYIAPEYSQHFLPPDILPPLKNLSPFLVILIGIFVRQLRENLHLMELSEAPRACFFYSARQHLAQTRRGGGGIWFTRAGGQAKMLRLANLTYENHIIF